MADIMNAVVRDLFASRRQTPPIVIGRAGEYGATTVTFDLRGFIDRYGTGTPSLLHKRPPDDEAYIVPPSATDTETHDRVETPDAATLVWHVGQVATSYVGNGTIELQWRLPGTTAKKTAQFDVVVLGAIGNPVSEIPNAQQIYLDVMQGIADDAEDAADRAEEAVSHYPKIVNGHWYVWDVNEGVYVDTGFSAQGDPGTPGADGHSPFINQNGYWVFWNYQTNTWRVTNLKAEGTPGADGYSPTVQLTSIQGGNRVTITDKNGPKEFEVDDGISPSVLVASIEGGHRVTITGAEGSRTFNVMDGAPGEDGDDGHSPYINNSGYWVIWNDSTGAWVTTNYKAAGTNGTDGHSPYIGQNGNWFAWDDNLATYDDTGIEAQGADGVSPTVTVTAITGGHRVTVTDATGPHTFDVMDGSGGSTNAVLYTPQTRADAQKAQARENIGIEFLNATDADDMWDDADADIPGTETFGTVLKITNKLLLKESNNLSRSDADWKDGYRVRNVAGDEVASPGISCSKMIPVEPGDVIRLFDLSGGTFGEREMRAVATFAADGTVVPNPDATGWKVRAYTVTEGVRYVRVSAPTASNYMVTKNYVPTAFEPWFEPYYVATDDFIRDAVGDVKTTDLSNQIAFALPQSAFRQTVGLPQTWYKRSMVSPVTEQVYVRGGEAGTTDDADKVTFANASAKNSANGYLWYAYDPFFNLLKKYDAGTGYGASAKVVAENLLDCTVLVIGDSTVDSDDLTGSLLSYFTQKGKTVTLLGTLFKSSAPLNRNEGRAGWSTADYTTDSTASGYTNPFYNPAAGAFDFSYYMAQQEYSGADFVVLQLGINDLYPSSPKNTTEPDYAAIWGNLKTMIDSIRAYDSGVKILINLPTTPNSDPTKHSICEFLYRHFVVRFNEYALARIKAEYGWDQVRATYCHLILDPAADIRDNVHPTAAGYAKMALEVINQINCWQNGT